MIRNAYKMARYSFGRLGMWNIPIILLVMGMGMRTAAIGAEDAAVIFFCAYFCSGLFTKWACPERRINLLPLGEKQKKKLLIDMEMIVVILWAGIFTIGCALDVIPHNQILYLPIYFLLAVYISFFISSLTRLIYYIRDGWAAPTQGSEVVILAGSAVMMGMCQWIIGETMGMAYWLVMLIGFVGMILIPAVRYLIIRKIPMYDLLEKQKEKQNEDTA